MEFLMATCKNGAITFYIEGLSMPIRYRGTRCLHDRGERHIVAYFHGGFGNDIDKAGDQEAIGVAIESVTYGEACFLERVDIRLVLRLEHMGCRGMHEGAVDGFCMTRDAWHGHST